MHVLGPRRTSDADPDLDTPLAQSVKRSVCDDPENYFFWDAIHPTTKAHGLIAEVADQAIKEAGLN